MPLQSILQKAIRDEGPLRFDDYVEQALYHPKFGYYRRPVQRVGRSEDSDFYTASSIDRLFGPLLIEACRSLLPCPPGECSFIEIGAEPDKGVLDGIEHPFAAVETLGYGDAFTGCDRPCVVFSNELFDAQPFRRFHFRNGSWQEGFVEVESDRLIESFRPVEDADALPFPAYTPAEPYTLDWPQRAEELCAQLLQKDWQGLWLCMDYGLDREVLLNERPEGTARSYSRHRQSNALLERPGECDLTCHICWNSLEDQLVKNSFSQLQRQTQEAFFMHHSTALIQQILTDAPGQFSQDRQSLKELLHPSHLGSRFQALSGLRFKTP
ncbi:MAG: SAM-dependent methyltransferase [Opitutales bacterium]|nr:SAM-dependent methyltransferase [Opitutales bacterium]